MKDKSIKKGTLLISEPFSADQNFERSVVLICEHDQEGSFGLVLNQATNLQLSDVIKEAIYPEIPLFLGGPIEHNTLHFIHRRADLIDGGVEIENGLFWGENFQQIIQLLNQGVLPINDIRCFLGYSGWGMAQLDFEIKKDWWMITQGNSKFIFETETKDFWKKILQNMGGDYKVISNYPIDPRLN